MRRAEIAKPEPCAGASHGIGPDSGAGSSASHGIGPDSGAGSSAGRGIGPGMKCGPEHDSGPGSDNSLCHNPSSDPDPVPGPNCDPVPGHTAGGRGIGPGMICGPEHDSGPGSDNSLCHIPGSGSGSDSVTGPGPNSVTGPGHHRTFSGGLNLAVLSVHSSPLGKPGSKDTGGMSVYLRELACALGEQGHRVDLFTRAARSGEGEREGDGEDEGEGCPPGAVIPLGPRARLVHLEAGRGRLTKLELYPHLPGFAANLERFRQARRLRYDIIFSHYWLSACAGLALQRRWDVPHLVMFHTLGAAKNAACAAENEPALRLRAEAALARESTRLIVASPSEKDELARRCAVPESKISVIPCGVNLDRFRPLDRGAARERDGFHGEKIILCVGRIEPVKGIDLAIRALALLPEKRGVRLLVAGGDAYSRPAVERLKNLARELGVGEAVTFTGAVEHERLPAYYSAASVTVIASHYESFGMTALESLACGTPVVAADVGDLKAIIRQGESGFVLVSRSPGEMAAKITACLDGRLTAGPSAIRATVTGFGWPAIARRIAAECAAVLVEGG